MGREFRSDFSSKPNTQTESGGRNTHTRRRRGRRRPHPSSWICTQTILLIYFLSLTLTVGEGDPVVLGTAGSSSVRSRRQTTAADGSRQFMANALIVVTHTQRRPLPTVTIVQEGWPASNSISFTRGILIIAVGVIAGIIRIIIYVASLAALAAIFWLIATAIILSSTILTAIAAGAIGILIGAGFEKLTPGPGPPAPAPPAPVPAPPAPLPVPGPGCMPAPPECRPCVMYGQPVCRMQVYVCPPNAKSDEDSNDGTSNSNPFNK